MRQQIVKLALDHPTVVDQHIGFGMGDIAFDPHQYISDMMHGGEHFALMIAEHPVDERLDRTVEAAMVVSRTGVVS